MSRTVATEPRHRPLTMTTFFPAAGMTVSRSSWSSWSESPESCIATLAMKSDTTSVTVAFFLWYLPPASCLFMTLTTMCAWSQDAPRPAASSSATFARASASTRMSESKARFFCGGAAASAESDSSESCANAIGRASAGARAGAGAPSCGAAERPTLTLTKSPPSRLKSPDGSGAADDAASPPAARTRRCSSRRCRSSSSRSCLRFLSSWACRASAAGSRLIHAMYQPFSVSSTAAMPALPRYMQKFDSVVHRVAFMWTWFLSAMYSW
mmetsp:Transcript_32336/g.111814  ORF Transcript_32336/g.111814 Transcript_32336/m.111814 type:complete len:268 (+) Transcript_32336:198-1001(+)